LFSASNYPIYMHVCDNIDGISSTDFVVLILRVVGVPTNQGDACHKHFAVKEAHCVLVDCS